MFKKVGAVALIGLLTLTGCGSQTSGSNNQGGSSQGAKEVKIGALLPLSGAVAPIGETCKRGQELATEEINAAGGIKSLGGAKLVLDFADSKGDPKVGMSEAERLIMKDKVAVMTGAYQSSVTYPSTQVAEKYKIPYVVPVSVMDDITERGFKYTFRLAPKASWYSRDQVKFSKEMGEQTGVVPKKVALVYENSDWGQSSAKGWNVSVPEAGMQIVLDAPYPSSSSDLAPVILKIKQANPDLILFTSYTSDAILLSNGIAEQKIDAMGMIGQGGGHADPEYLKNVGKNAEYGFDLTEWSPDLGKPGVKETNAKFKQKYGVDMNGEAAESYASMYVIADALERAGSAEPEKIREALTKTKITSGPGMILPYDSIEFDESGQNPKASLIMVQVHDGVRSTVWPFSAKNPDYKVVWPAPKWADRK
ncbi:MAG: ABC transporter substrate-binding protein [Desulfitobacteriaceae bacterium]